MDHFEIKRIEKEESDSFLADHVPETLGLAELRHTVVRNFGFFKNGILWGLIQASYPLELEHRNKATLEIFNWHFVNRDNDMIQKSLKLLQSLSKISDLIITAPVLSSEFNVLSELNFTITDDDNWFWQDPNLSFYTYKITSSQKEDNFYYIGVRHLKIKEATMRDCLEDSYTGSGGLHPKNKFRVWKDTIGIKNVHKQIISLHDTKAAAYEAEFNLIGDSWKSDPNCLNSRRGGFCPTTIDECVLQELNCDEHGLVLHARGVCCFCTARKSINQNDCIIHGMTTHRGDKCCKCTRNDTISVKKCSDHGDVIFYGNTCGTCVSQKSITVKECEKHGRTKHRGAQCCMCIVDGTINLKLCVSHGETKHKGDSCFKCVTEEMISEETCTKHGITKHQWNVCSKCLAEQSIHFNWCEEHQWSKHRNDKCFQCSHKKSMRIKTCVKHGKVTHKGNACLKCKNNKIINEKICEKHGFTKHQGKSCCKCNGEKAGHAKHVKNGIHKTTCDLCKAETT